MGFVAIIVKDRVQLLALHEIYINRKVDARDVLAKKFQAS